MSNRTSNERVEHCFFALTVPCCLPRGHQGKCETEVSRLTARVAELEASPGELHFRGVMKDNADLAAEIERLEELTDRQSKHITDTAYENGRLRAALERIAHQTRGVIADWEGPDVIHAIAITALAGAADETDAEHGR